MSNAPYLPVMSGDTSRTAAEDTAALARTYALVTLKVEFVPLMVVDDSARSVAMGFDDGAVMIKIGREEPVASMDASGKIIWARHNEIQTVNIKSLGGEYDEASLIVRTYFLMWPWRLRAAAR